MHLVTYGIIGLLIALIMYLVVIYNNLVTLKNNVKKSWSNIDVLLKQRHDEIPKLVETCKQYMQYERPTLEAITESRNKVMSALQKGDIPALNQAESTLHRGLSGLFALAENYPDLKTNSTFLHLQARISDLENSIADRREFYNESVNLNNIRIEQFPDIIVAKLLGFQHLLLLEYQEERNDPDMGALFKK